MRRKVVGFPGWISNPYINLLYLAPRGAGWDVATPQTMAELVPMMRQLKRADVLHVHWLAPVFAGATDDADAAARGARFCRLLDEASERGVRLLWTVHNLVTHDSPYYEHEVRVSVHLAELAEAVVVLNEETPEIAAPHYAIPTDRVYYLPHCSYLGVYPQDMRRNDARAALGLGLQDLVVGFIGQVRPYKGIDLLIDAVSTLHRSGVRVTLVIAGKTPEDELDTVGKRIETCPAIVRWHPYFVAETELQEWFRASDVIAAPYARVLNSGTVYLSASFGIPCVLPDEPQFRSLFGNEAWVTLFDRGAAAEGLAEALMLNLPQRQDAVDAAEQFARERTPFDMSLNYLTLLER